MTQAIAVASQPTLEFKVEPWAHQLKAINEARTKNEYALFFEMGAGKTMTAINMLREKCVKHRRVLRTLILCPSIVRDNWQEEIERHSKFEPWEYVTLSGTGKQRIKKFHECGAKIFITNHEAMAVMKELYAAIEAWKPEVIILDESHRCKDIKAKRTKAIIRIADQTMYRYILSGSPILKDPADLFAQFRILDRGATFGKNFFVFRNEYFYDKNAQMPAAKHFPDWRLRVGAEVKITEKIAKRSMRVMKSECLDLPPLVRQKIYVELSGIQKKLYDEMKQDFITFMHGKACAAPLAMTKALRLQEIVSGFVSVEGEQGYEKIQLADNPRATALRELLEEITPHSKALVWACFKENYKTIRAILDDLGVGYVVVHGQVSDEEKKAAVLRFQSDPTCRVFLGHPGSGGIGINLVAASYSIFYSRSFSLEHDLQATARNHRGGSEIHDKITRIDLVAKNTIDEKSLEKLEAKVAIGEAVLRDLVS